MPLLRDIVREHACLRSLIVSQVPIDRAQTPAVQNQPAIRQAAEVVGVMARDQNRLAHLFQAEQELLGAQPRFTVQVCRGFVEQQRLRSAQPGTRQRNPLAFTASNRGKM